MPRTILTLMCCIVLTSLTGFAQSFSYGGFPTATSASWITTGDFDRNGYPDVAVAEQNVVEIYTNYRGTYTFKSSIAAASPTQVETADFNHDGFLDLVVSSVSQAQLNIYWGQGDGTFTPGPVIKTAFKVWEVEPASLVKAAVPDLVTRECNSATPAQCDVRVYRNNGTGTFQAGISAITLTTNLQQSASRGLALMDFSGDGKTDLAVALKDGFSVYRGNGNGTFSTPTHYAVSGGVASIAVASLRNNSLLDLVVSAPAPCSNPPCQNYAEAYLNKGAGSFALRSKNLLYGQMLVASDFNQDGYPDIVGLHGGHYEGGLSYLRGHGNGYFDPYKKIAFPDTGDLPVARDMNWDGKHDFLYPEYLGGDVAVWTNTGAAAPCPGATAAELNAVLCSLGASQTGYVTVHGDGNSPAGVVRMEFWLDGKKIDESWNDQIVVHFTVSRGTHHLVLIAVDKFGATAKSGEYVNLP